MAVKDLDLEAREEGGTEAKRKYSEFLSLLFSYPACLHLTLMHEL